MENILSKIVGILVGVIMLTIIPALLLNMYVDIVEKEEIRNELKIFVDKVRNCGKIDKIAYDEFTANIYSIRNDANVEILIKRTAYLKNKKAETPKQKVILFTELSVNEALRNSNQCNMQIGDEFIMCITLKNRSAINVMMEKIFGTNSVDLPIRYGGLIRYEDM